MGLALSELIVQVMEMTEERDCFDWTHTMFEHLAVVAIHYVDQRATRVNEIIKRLNQRVRVSLTLMANQSHFCSFYQSAKISLPLYFCIE